eukprot:Transcript_183.p2 GENE.Transcript_183~~Transcript_183.p2  ORF type:complete len:94 (+),score=9.66 Transcript_183:1-282(+)
MVALPRVQRRVCGSWPPHVRGHHTKAVRGGGAGLSCCPPGCLPLLLVLLPLHLVLLPRRLLLGVVAPQLGELRLVPLLGLLLQLLLHTRGKRS